MSRAILLVICDFLLLSLLALANFNKPDEEEEPEPQAELVEAQADADLVELLEMSLDSEQNSRDTLEDELERRDEVLKQKEEEIAHREALLKKQLEAEQKLKENIESLSDEKSQLLSDQAKMKQQEEALLAREKELQGHLEQQKAQKGNLQDSLAITEERLRVAQESLKQQQNALAKKNDELKAATETLAHKEKQQAILETKLESAGIAQQRLEVQLEGERVAKEQAEQRASHLAQNVSELAQSSDELKKELVKSTPLSLNEIYNRFKDNQLRIGFATEEKLLFGSERKTYVQSAIPLKYKGDTYALFTLQNTPFKPDVLKNVQKIRGQFEINGNRYDIPGVNFLDADHRVALVRLPSALLEKENIVPFELESESLRFPEAVLITSSGDKYGEAPFKIHSEDDHYFDIESRLFSRLFGSFAPGGGDFVFSKNGQFIGIMVDSQKCLLIPRIGNSSMVILGKDFSSVFAEQMAEKIKLDLNR